MIGPFASAIAGPVATAITQAGAGGQSLDSAVRALFANGEQGIWLDPSDMSTMFQDAAGTTPVTAAGQVVGKILDKSGRGNHATQADAAKKPLLQQDGNGEYYLAFDGVDDGLVTASINFTGTNKITVVASVRKLSDAAVGCIVETGTNRTAAGCFGVRGPAGDPATYDIGATGAVGTGFNTSPASFAAPHTAVVTASFDISQLGYPGIGPLRINGVQQANSFLGAGVGTVGMFANAEVQIGRLSAGILPFNGHIYQLIVRGAATTLADIQSAEAFTAGKTGVTL